VELVADDRGGAPVELGRRVRGRGLMVGLGVAAVLVAGIVFVGRNNGGTTAPPTVPTTVTPTTTASATATTATTATTDTPVAGPPRFVPGTGPVLGPTTTGTLWSVVRAAGGDDVVAIDLATGGMRRRRVGFAVGDAAQLFVTADAGALVFTGAGAERIGPGLDVSDIRGVPAMAPLVVSPTGDVWGVPVGQSTELLHVALRSLAVPERVELPPGTFFSGVDSTGAPWASSDGGTLAFDAAMRTWRPVSPAPARLVDGTTVIERLCTNGSCVDQIRDLTTGAAHALDPVDAVPGYWFAFAAAPTGGDVAALVDDGPAGVRLVEWDGVGHVVAQQPAVDLTAARFVTFTVDGSYLLFADGPALRVRSLTDGTVTPAPAAEARLNGLLAGSVVVAAATSVG
jgi:hypothetical protein